MANHIIKGVLDGCENAKGCRKVAVKTLEVTDGVRTETARLCAYCAADVMESEANAHLTITEVSA